MPSPSATAMSPTAIVAASSLYNIRMAIGAITCNGTFCSVLSPLLWGHSASFYFFYKVGFCDIYWIHSLKRFVLQVATAGYFNSLFLYINQRRKWSNVGHVFGHITHSDDHLKRCITCHLAIAWAKMPRRRQNDMGFF